MSHALNVIPEWTGVWDFMRKLGSIAFLFWLFLFVILFEGTQFRTFQAMAQVKSGWDLVQDDRIDNQGSSLRDLRREQTEMKTDAKADRVVMLSFATDLAQQRGMMIGFGSALTVLQALGLIVNIKARAKQQN